MMFNKTIIHKGDIMLKSVREGTLRKGNWINGWVFFCLHLFILLFLIGKQKKEGES